MCAQGIKSCCHFRVHVCLLFKASLSAKFLVGRPTLGLPVYFFANVRHVQWAIPQICSEGSMFIPLRFHFSSVTEEVILCDGRHLLQVWQKRVTVLGPIPSNHLQTHRLFVVDPHQNTKMSMHFERGRSANSWPISQMFLSSSYNF